MTRSILVLGLAGIFLLACDDSSATSPANALRSPTGGAALDRHASPIVETTRDSKILSFETMYGVDDAFVDSDAIRGVLGDELPWQVGSAVGFLTVGGHLKVSVRGIVFTHDDEVPREIRGINDEETFRALVSCLLSEHGQIKRVNIATEQFPATRSGDSNIDAHIHLPGDCVAPIIFILSGSEDHWFAVTGAETS
jgi:hypothetical protein